MSGDELDLDAVEGRARALTYALGRDHIGAVASFGHTVGDQDVPALVAEVRRLRAALDDTVSILRKSKCGCGCYIADPLHPAVVRIFEARR